MADATAVAPDAVATDQVYVAETDQKGFCGNRAGPRTPSSKFFK